MSPGARAPSSSVLPLQKEPGPSSFHQCRRRGSSHPWLRQQSPLPIGPLPVADLWQIIPILGDVFLMFNEFIADRLLHISSDVSKFRHTVDDISYQVEAVQIVPDDHVERSRRCALFFVPSNVKIPMVGSPIGETMNEPRIAMKGKDNRLVGSE